MLLLEHAYVIIELLMFMARLLKVPQAGSIKVDLARYFGLPG